MATLSTTTGAVVDVHPKHRTAFTLAEAQALVDGYLELMPRPLWATDEAFWRAHVVLVDEDGRLKPTAQVNPGASLRCEQRLFGSVLVLTEQEWEAAMAAPDGDAQDTQGVESGRRYGNDGNASAEGRHA